jgi:hypothetical protein
MKGSELGSVNIDVKGNKGDLGSQVGVDLYLSYSGFISAPVYSFSPPK